MSVADTKVRSAGVPPSLPGTTKLQELPSQWARYGRELMKPGGSKCPVTQTSFGPVPSASTTDQMGEPRDGPKSSAVTRDQPLPVQE